jgi:hypothetical protein
MESNLKNSVFEPSNTKQGKIDAHVHYVTESYRTALAEKGIVNPDRFPVPAWDVQTHLETMETLNIATACLSITSPGIHFGDDAAAKALACQVNEEGLAKTY